MSSLRFFTYMTYPIKPFKRIEEAGGMVIRCVVRASLRRRAVEPLLGLTQTQLRRYAYPQRNAFFRCGNATLCSATHYGASPVRDAMFQLIDRREMKRGKWRLQCDDGQCSTASIRCGDWKMIEVHYWNVATTLRNTFMRYHPKTLDHVKYNVPQVFTFLYHNRHCTALICYGPAISVIIIFSIDCNMAEYLPLWRGGGKVGCI